MPHYYEFNPAENPNRNGWCGHTALKIAGQYISGQTKTLQQIHNTFTLNSAGYANQEINTPNAYCGNNPNFHWCASLQDLMWAARLPQNGGYGRSAIAGLITTYSSNTDFFNKVKAAINLNQPVIIPSNWKYANIGHFWVIVGYTDWGSPVGSALYLRDVALSAPKAPNADWAVDVNVFYGATPIKQMLIVK